LINSDSDCEEKEEEGKSSGNLNEVVDDEVRFDDEDLVESEGEKSEEKNEVIDCPVEECPESLIDSSFDDVSQGIKELLSLPGFYLDFLFFGNN